MQRSDSHISISTLEQDFAKMGKVSLLDALRDMKIDNVEEVYEKSIEKSKKALSLQKTGLSVEEGAAIAAYFYKIPEPKKFDITRLVNYGVPQGSGNFNPNPEMPPQNVPAAAPQPPQGANERGTLQCGFGGGERGSVTTDRFSNERGSITEGDFSSDIKETFIPIAQTTQTTQTTQSTTLAGDIVEGLAAVQKDGLDEDCDPEARDGEVTVYRVVTDALSDPTPKKREKLERIKRFLYLFLKALRSLPRYHARNFTLYRTMMIYCPITRAEETSETLPNIWWDFPYVSSDMSDCDDPFFNFHKYGEPTKGQNVLKKFKCIISSKENGPWGYDVSRFTDEKTNMSKKSIISFLFSFYFHYSHFHFHYSNLYSKLYYHFHYFKLYSKLLFFKGLLMEPEVQYTLSVSFQNVNYEVNIAPLKLEHPIKPSHKKNQELIPRDDRVAKAKGEAVAGFRAKDTFYNGVTLTWDKSKTQEAGTIYEVVRVDGILLAQKLVPVYRGSGNEVSTSGLEAGKKYSFRVRRGTDEYWGPWSKDLTFKTENYPKIMNIKCENVSTRKVKISWDDVKVCPDTEPNYNIQSRAVYDDKVAKFGLPNTSHTPSITFDLKDLESTNFSEVKEFQFRVQTEKGEYSEIVAGRAIKSVLPQNPRVVNKTNESITLAWDLNPDTTVDHCLWKDKTLCYKGRDTQYTLAGLDPDEKFKIKIGCAVTVDGKKLTCDENMILATQAIPYNFPGFWKYTAGSEYGPNRRILVSRAMNGMACAGVSNYTIDSKYNNNNPNLYWKVRINGFGPNSSGNIGIGFIKLANRMVSREGVFFNCANWCIYFGDHQDNVLEAQGQGPSLGPGDEVVVQFNTVEHTVVFMARGMEMRYSIGKYDEKAVVFAPAVIMYSYGDSVELLSA